MSTKISIQDFEALCQNGHRYEGEVEGLGTVYWRPKHFNTPYSGLPGQNVTQNAEYEMDIYEMVVTVSKKQYIDYNKAVLIETIRKQHISKFVTNKIVIQNFSSDLIFLSEGSQIDIDIEETGLVVLKTKDSKTGERGSWSKDLSQLMGANYNQTGPVQNYQEIERMRELLKGGSQVFGGFDLAYSYKSLAPSKNVILGPEYIRTPAGPLIRNTNRVYTTTGKIAANVGKKLFVVGVVVDVGLAAAGAQTWEEAGVSIAINTGIYIIGMVCPPLGVALGTIHFLNSIFGGGPVGVVENNYEKIHGTIAPGDAIQVQKPRIEPLSIPKKKPTYEQKQYEFRQGRR